MEEARVASPPVPSRKLRNSLPAGTQSEMLEPLRKRGVRRSASMLSQMETQADTMGNNTPTPKRARASLSQDVSEAKRNPSSQTRQLSHVLITPRGHSSARKGKSKDMASDVTPQMSDGTRPAGARSELSQADQSQSHSQLSAPSETATPSRSDPASLGLRWGSASCAAPSPPGCALFESYERGMRERGRCRAAPTREEAGAARHGQSGSRTCSLYTGSNQN